MLRELFQFGTELAESMLPCIASFTFTCPLAFKSVQAGMQLCDIGKKRSRGVAMTAGKWIVMDVPSKCVE